MESSSHIGNLRAFSNLHKIRIQVTCFGLDKVILELEKLLTQCPGLADLDISVIGLKDNESQLPRFLVPKTGEPLSLRHLRMDGITVSPGCLKLAIGNLRSLHSLHIHRYLWTWTHMGPTIWDILRTEKLYIRNLSTDAPDNSFLRYICSFNGLRKLSITKRYPSYPLDPNAILQIMIPHHAESLTEVNMQAASLSLVIFPILPENLINTLSSFKNIQYFGLQLHFAECYISIIVCAFCNTQYVSFIILTWFRSWSKGFIIQTCTKIFPKLQRLVLHTMVTSRLQRAISSPTMSIHDAITQYQPDDLFVSSFEIECEGRVYFPGQEGTFSYIT